MWGEYALGFHTTHADIGRWTGFLSVIFPILGMVWALRLARHQRGQLGFRSGMGHAVAVSLGATLSMTLMSAMYVTWLHPSWLEASDTSRGTFLLQSAGSTFIGGVAVGAIALIFMRTRKTSQ